MKRISRASARGNGCNPRLSHLMNEAPTPSSRRPAVATKLGWADAAEQGSMSPEAEAQFLKGIATLPSTSLQLRKRSSDDEEPARTPLRFPNIGVRGEAPGTRRMVLKPSVLTVRQGTSGLAIAAVRNAKQKDAYAPSEPS
jgi:hypothetical protein